MLIKNKAINILPLIHGGKSSTVYRSGTPALPLIVSSMTAIEIATSDMDNRYKYVDKLNKKIIDKLSEYNDVFINSTKYSISYVINISLNKIKPETFIHAMDEYEVYLSTKSACSDSSIMSDSVYAVVKDRNRASHSIRISLSYKTTEEEVDKFLILFDEVYKKLNFV